MLGFISLVNHFYGFEANSYLLVAILTVLGYSIHDTIVVFDRIRENILHHPGGEKIESIVERSVDQTLARSLNTSLTLILVLLALTTIGGGAIRPFVLTLLVGITFGTYSSIFLAASILTDWGKHNEKKIAARKVTKISHGNKKGFNKHRSLLFLCLNRFNCPRLRFKRFFIDDVGSRSLIYFFK